MVNTTLCNIVNNINGNLVYVDALSLSHCVRDYGELVRNYVASNLDIALCAEIGDRGPNVEGLTIYKALKNDANLRERVINLIAAHGIVFSLDYYKNNIADNAAREMHFMQQIYNFLQPYHMFVLAKKYMDVAAIVSEDKKEQSR